MRILSEVSFCIDDRGRSPSGVDVQPYSEYRQAGENHEGEGEESAALCGGDPVYRATGVAVSMQGQQPETATAIASDGPREPAIADGGIGSLGVSDQVFSGIAYPITSSSVPTISSFAWSVFKLAL